MKLIHTADLHLDSKMESNLDPEQAQLRRQELLERFSELVEYAVENEVQAILIAGDLFDKTRIRKNVKTRVLDEIRLHPDLDFLYLKGNHDNNDLLQDVDLSELKNLKMFESEKWTSYTYEEVVITGRELTAANARTLTMNLVLDGANCNIVMLHGQESEYEGKDRTEVIPLNELKGKYIDYLALGHIHSYKKEKLDDRGEYCYSGCLEGRGFDECGEKGFVLLNVNDGKVKSEFVPFAKRHLHEVEIRVSEEDDMPSILDRLQEIIRDIPEEDLVKVVFTGETEVEFDIDTVRVQRILDRKFFFAKIYDRTRNRVHYEDFINDKSLKGEFVRLMETEEIDEAQKGRIVEIGVKALMGEEIEW